MTEEIEEKCGICGGELFEYEHYYCEDCRCSGGDAIEKELDND